MLEELHVRDLALIEEAWLELGPGLTVLTGETGAGKTVLVGALKLLLGDRGDATFVRTGAQEAVVEGRFRVDGTEHAARRRVGADGRSRCYLDGEMATVSGLADVLGPLVDLHGQHDHQTLLHASSHAALLDRFAGQDAVEALATYREAFRACSEASGALASLRDALGDRERRLDYLRFVVAEVDETAPRDGEDVAISERLPLMRHGERLTQSAAAAHRALSDDEGAGDAVAEALATLQHVGGVDPVLDTLVEELVDIDARVSDIASRLRSYGEGIDYDPEALNEAEARLAALSTLKRKYGPALADVLAARDAAATEAEALQDGEVGLARAAAALETADAAVRVAADRVMTARATAVPGFVAALGAAAADLAMAGASFDVSCAPLPREAWTSDGPQRVEFLYAPAAGETPRPLARIASGGEISRVMLALKSVLGAADTGPVLVFDEIDAGIGGATALAVGRRLRELARGRQVLVVTHLAQVAAFAVAHLVVAKAEEAGRIRTTVRPVTETERVAEVARMLSGSVSDTSLAHARELLASVSA
jgi:DNA repair protein RecN (Recombination protein N)